MLEHLCVPCGANLSQLRAISMAAVFSRRIVLKILEECCASSLGCGLWSTWQSERNFCTHVIRGLIVGSWAFDPDASAMGFDDCPGDG